MKHIIRGWDDLVELAAKTLDAGDRLVFYLPDDITLNTRVEDIEEVARESERERDDE